MLVLVENVLVGRNDVRLKRGSAGWKVGWLCARFCFRPKQYCDNVLVGSEVSICA